MSLTITKAGESTLAGGTIRVDNVIEVTLSGFDSVANTQVALFSPNGTRLTAQTGDPSTGTCTLQCSTQEIVDFFAGLDLTNTHNAILAVGVSTDIQFQCDIKLQLNPFFSASTIYPVLNAVLSVNHILPDVSGNVNLLSDETMTIIGDLFDPDLPGADINLLTGMQLSEQIANIIRVLKALDVRTS